jgi:hypothetical protein
LGCNSAKGGTLPVHRIDATTAQANLDVLGYFDVPDSLGANVEGAISLDGGTLFFAGLQNLVVVPVPATLSTS